MSTLRTFVFEFGKFLQKLAAPASPSSASGKVEARAAELPSPERRSAQSPRLPAWPTSLESQETSVASTEGQQLLWAIQSKAPVILLHGPAGSGKSTMIRALGQQGLQHAVLAPTGIAALNAEGCTLHSFFGIPPRLVSLDEIRPSRKLATLLRRLDFIVIDEISMVRADIVDVIDRTLRLNLKPSLPFGGMCLVLVGDFFQLPPVTPPEEEAVLRSRGYQVFHCFGAAALQQIRPHIVEVNTIYRQQDPEFLKLLQHVRTGDHLENTIASLNTHCLRPHRSSAIPVLLTSTKEKSWQYNQIGLQKLAGPPVTFRGIFEKNFRLKGDKLPVPELLELKVGARIVMVKNDENQRWVNGSLGTVMQVSTRELFVRIDGSSSTSEVKQARWEDFRYVINPATGRVEHELVGSYTQYPLTHAWAITIHKAQGLSLDDVRIDLGHGTFAPGQAYVALSRARSLPGLSFAAPLRLTDIRVDSRLAEGVASFRHR